MNTPEIFPKKLNRTAVVIAIVSVVVILFLGTRSLNAQTLVTPTNPTTSQPQPQSQPNSSQQSVLPPMPNYIDLPTAPKNPAQTKAGRRADQRTQSSPNFTPECRGDDMACIEQRNRLNSTGGSDVDPEFVR